MSMKKFEIELKETETDNIFYIIGELDLSVAMQFRIALEPIVKMVDKTLILDLEHLEYIDSTGIGIIISVLKLREECDAKFYVRNIPAMIKRLLDLTGVSGFLKEGSEKSI